MNTWIAHVKRYQQLHNCSYKEALIKSKPSYRKQQIGGSLIKDVLTPINTLVDYAKDLDKYGQKHNVGKKGELPTFNEFLVNLGQNTLATPELLTKAAKKNKFW